MSRSFGILAAAQLSIVLFACVAPAGEAPDESSRAFGSSAGITRSQLLSNNTSASSLFRDQYTPAARFTGAKMGVVSNGDAATSATAATHMEVGGVSKVPTRSLLYPGSKTKIFVETQGWFCTDGRSPLSSALGTDQCGSHIDIGYASNSTKHAQAQVADMISRGIDGVISNWTGQSAGNGVIDAPSTSSSALSTGEIFATKKAAEASGGKFQFALMEDEGIKDCAANPKCDVTQALISDLQFIATNFYPSSAYYRVDGRPVLFFFSVDAWAKKYDKTIVWKTVRASAAKAGNPLFVFENGGAFDHDENDGGYSWLSPTDYAAYAASGDPFGTASFLPSFYKQAKAHPTKLTFGSAYKGFDDQVVNGWSDVAGGRRYAGQQCGKTWLDTFRTVNKSYSASAPLAGLQLVTWDDYEEGTELETGIESYASVTASVSGGALEWRVGVASNAAADCVKATKTGFDIGETIHHYAVYASPTGDGESLSLVADNIAPSARSLDLTGKLPAGTWLLYVYAVGQPSIRNHISNAVKSDGSGGAPSPPPPGDDGCVGNPVILEPTLSEAVGPAIHIRATAPSCIERTIAYVDGKQVAAGTDTLDAWVSVSMGPHTVNVNGWAGTAIAHASPQISFERTY